MAINGLHHLALTVRDMERSKAFYMGLLGFSVLSESDDDGHQVARLQHPESSVLISLHVHAANAGQAFDERTTGLDHFALAVDTAEELERWAEDLEAADVPHSPIKPGRRPGLSILVLRDPDDIQLELVHLADIPSAPAR
jgi:catechol 2,3-dioxygenase-like lactoylglutathione lyase family enzyme